MKIENTDKWVWQRFFSQYSIPYCGGRFSILNKEKAESLRWLSILDGDKVRFGLIAGQRNDTLHAPFSAPFSAFLTYKRESSLAYAEAVKALVDYLDREKLNMIFVAAPDCYREAEQAKVLTAMYANGFAIEAIDLNYVFILRQFPDYIENLRQKARKKLRLALEEDFETQIWEKPSEDILKEAYRIIHINRLSLGYDLSMSEEEVIRTCKIIEADVFIIRKTAEARAAALVFHSGKGVVQVVYWGHIPSPTEDYVMNLLAFKLFRHYYEKGYDYVDIGPAGKNGNVFHSLAQFKDSIGALAIPKFTLRYDCQENAFRKTTGEKTT